MRTHGIDITPIVAARNPIPVLHNFLY